MKIYKIFASVIASMLMLASCNDEPDAKYYYSFKGEMMSQYLANRSQFSMFNEVMNRTGFISLLSTYGNYTCFAPDNEAMSVWLEEKGLQSVGELTDAKCDSLARIHLSKYLYSTMNMSGSISNMLGREQKTKQSVDENLNPVILLELADTLHFAQILFETQNDSVENGIVHRINRVLEVNEDLLPEALMKDERIRLFSEAYQLTGIASYITNRGDKDYDYVPSGPEWIHFRTGGSLDNPIKESAKIPEERRFGFTAFVVPDDVLEKKYGVKSIDDLYKLAARLYASDMKKDSVAGLQAGHANDVAHYADSVNPLFRFMAYHTLNRNVCSYNRLTVCGNNEDKTRDFGVMTSFCNPTDWYETMLPHRMVKVEHLTNPDWVGSGQCRGTHDEIYINRRVDNFYPNESGVRGAQVSRNAITPDGGTYFYIDSVLCFDEKVRDIVFNTRMRMDFSTIFPEVMTNKMRMNGNLMDDPSDYYEGEGDYGCSYYFPDGYLEDVDVRSGQFIYRRPRRGYWSLHGDEFICQGEFDIVFRIPPVPKTGDYQVRLGFAAMSVRGIAQIYFGDNPKDLKPQGIPLDMRRDLSHESLLGSDFKRGGKNYTAFDSELKSLDRKTLKNLGYYRGANAHYLTTDGKIPESQDVGNVFANISATLRMVLCTVHMEEGKDYYVRIRKTSDGLGNDEAMLDYLELVPKSVYGVTNGDMQEDDM